MEDGHDRHASVRSLLFDNATIDLETAVLNAKMIELMKDQPDWWIIRADDPRAARRRSAGPFPPAVMSIRARTIAITGRHGNTIPPRCLG